ncbi:MRP-L47-domain-containing protein [Gyrodon lividus]|nr:MRP-L47-domain-containing protein [Gyrodon lividus]
MLEAPEGHTPASIAANPDSTASPKRPHLGIEVDPNHGLWAFFRKKEVDGVAKYETMEARESLTESGRPWTAAELRRKSFKDLHTLWYVLLRERNLLATQKEEARRLGVNNPEALAAPTMDRMCRKSMARLKFVTNERRLHYEKLFEEGGMSTEELLKVPEPPKQPTCTTRRSRARRKSGTPSPSHA